MILENAKEGSKETQTKLTTLSKPNENLLHSRVVKWFDSEERKTMLTAQEYYKNNNDILKRKRYYIDRKGVQQEVTNLSNSKLSHPFLRKLTNQKVNYLLSKELSVQTDNETLNDILEQRIDKKFLKMLKNVGRDAIVNGIAWVQVYYNEKGELNFKRIPSQEIIPFWVDIDHTILEGVLRVYNILEVGGKGEETERTKVEYHTLEGSWFYVMGKDGLKQEKDPTNHFTIIRKLTKEEKENQGQKGKQEENKKEENKEEEEYGSFGVNWDKVPFIAFKYNSDEMSLLTWIKPLIDDYDINTSDTSNNLQDIPNSIKVVKNYDGTDKGEFTQNLNIFRTAFVSGDGDLKVIETNLDVSAIDSHLNRLRKDIYEAGNGVDTQEVSVGNASGVALKFRYADLDTDTDDMRAEFLASLEELTWFIKVDLLQKGLGNFMEESVEYIFNTDMIINESETIVDATNSLGILSEETIIANHPWVTNVQNELDRVKKEKERNTLNMFSGFDEFNNEFAKRVEEEENQET